MFPRALRPSRAPSAAFALGALLALPLAAAEAHNLGRTLFAHTMSLAVDRREAVLTYEVEVPTPFVMRRYYALYRATEGEVPREELDKRFTAEMLDELARGLTLRAGGRALETTLGATEEGTTGLGNLQFFRYKLALSAPLPEDAADGVEIEARNGNFVGESAVHRSEVLPAKGLEVARTTIPSDADAKDYLVDEVTGLRWSLREGHRRWRAEVREESLGAALRRMVASGAPAGGAAATAAAPKAANAREGRLFDLLRQATLTPPVVAGALALAFALGAMHALTPGHGKTLVAAYLVGSRGTVGHAVALGGIVTFTHTFTVVLLGLAALFAAERFAPERIGPVLGAVSGLMIVGVGVLMFRRLLPGGRPHHHHGDDDLFHAHDHDHDHADGRDHGHTHLPPDRVTMGSLVALGVSGGLVPCPSAMVLLLTAVALGRIAFGLTLVVAFSVGLALVLIVLGVLLVTAKGFAARLGGEGGLMETAARRLPLVSATAVTVLGLLITWKSLADAGGAAL